MFVVTSLLDVQLFHVLFVSACRCNYWKTCNNAHVVQRDLDTRSRATPTFRANTSGENKSLADSYISQKGSHGLVQEGTVPCGSHGVSCLFHFDPFCGQATLLSICIFFWLIASCLDSFSRNQMAAGASHCLWRSSRMVAVFSFSASILIKRGSVSTEWPTEGSGQ